MSAKNRRCRPRDLAVVISLVVSGVSIAAVLAYLAVESENDQATQAFEGTFAEPVSLFQQYFTVRVLGVRAVADALSLFPPGINRSVSQPVSVPQGAPLCW